MSSRDNTNEVDFKIEYMRLIELPEEYSDVEAGMFIEEIDNEELYKSFKYTKEFTVDVLQTYNENVDNRKHNAAVLVDRLPAVVKYYEAITHVLADHPAVVNGFGDFSDFKIACGFSPNNINAIQNWNGEENDDIVDIINDYNKQFSTDDIELDFSIDNLEEYMEDVKRRMANKEIDMLIIGCMGALAMRNPYLNTIYVDKNVCENGFKKILNIPTIQNIIVYRPIRERIEKVIKEL